MRSELAQPLQPPAPAVPAADAAAAAAAAAVAVDDPPPKSGVARRLWRRIAGGGDRGAPHSDPAGQPAADLGQPPYDVTPAPAGGGAIQPASVQGPGGGAQPASAPAPAGVAQRVSIARARSTDADIADPRAMPQLAAPAPLDIADPTDVHDGPAPPSSSAGAAPAARWLSRRRSPIGDEAPPASDEVIAGGPSGVGAPQAPSEPTTLGAPQAPSEPTTLGAPQAPSEPTTRAPQASSEPGAPTQPSPGAAPRRILLSRRPQAGAAEPAPPRAVPSRLARQPSGDDRARTPTPGTVDTPTGDSTSAPTSGAVDTPTGDATSAPTLDALAPPTQEAPPAATSAAVTPVPSEPAPISIARSRAGAPRSPSAALPAPARAQVGEPARAQPNAAGDRPRLQLMRSEATPAPDPTSEQATPPSLVPGSLSARLLARSTPGAIEYEDEGRTRVLFPPPGSVLASPGDTLARETGAAAEVAADAPPPVVASPAAAAAASPAAPPLDRDELYADFMRRLRRDVLEQREQRGDI